MTFERFFRRSSYVLIASGYIAIAATGTIDPYSTALFGAAFIASCFLDTAKIRRQIPSWALNIAGAACLLLYLLDYEFLTHSFLISTIHVVFVAASMKILTLASDRDYFLLYLISFAELLAASTLTIDVTFVLSLLVFTISAISTSILFEMRRSNARARKLATIRPFVAQPSLQGTEFELFSHFSGSTFTLMSLAITGLIVLLALPLFFFLPRITAGVYNRASNRTQLVSGFSDRVELGELGTIKRSDRIVMRVKTDKPLAELPSTLKWRGIALDHYDGRAWSRGSVAKFPQRALAHNGEATYFQLERSALSTDLLLQTYYVEPLATDVVFASHRVLAISNDIDFLQRDFAGTLFTVPHAFKKLRYKAISDLTPPDPSQIVLRPDLIPDEVKACCLQMPPLDPRISGLADQMAGSSVNPFERARAIENQLRTHYTYTLDLKGSPTSKDPIAMFLFDVQAGHCEYFASAMAILLRSVGIPSRIVNGFRTGEYNSLADDWTVRQYDAHSWVEAYLPPYGWLEFDPTPADPGHARSGLSRMITDFLDAVDMWWTEEVVNFDLWKQYQIKNMIRSRIQDLQAGMKALLASLSRPSKPRSATASIPNWTIAYLLIAFMALLIIVRYRSGWKRFFATHMPAVACAASPRFVVTSFYKEALALLQAHGLHRRHDQTPSELVQRLSGHPAEIPFSALTALYNRIRFGALAHRDDAKEAQTLLRDLKTALCSSSRTFH